MTFTTPDLMDVPSVNATGGGSAATQRGNSALAVFLRKNPGLAERHNAITAILAHENVAADAAFEAAQRARTLLDNAGEAVAFYDEAARERGISGDGPERTVLLAEQKAARVRVDEAWEASSTVNNRRGGTRAAVNSAVAKLNGLSVADTKVKLTTEKLPSGKHPADVVSQVRERIASLEAERGKVANAPIPKEQVKAAVTERLSTLVAKGTPKIHVARNGTVDIRWPIEPLYNVMAPGSTDPTVIEVPALLAALMPDEMEKLLLDAVDQRYANLPIQPLDSAARAKKLDSIAKDILAAERLEVAAVIAAHKVGVDLGFRESTSPEALLGIE